MLKNIADEITLCDIKPKLALAVKNDLSHAASSYGIDVKLYHAERDEEVNDADIVIIAAGYTRPQDKRINRREFAIYNAKVIKQISEASRDRNKRAKYVVITNPVDAMAMLCYHFTNSDFVIGTGTSLDSMRLRAILSEKFNVPVTRVKGWVCGEHGDNLVILWSSVMIEGISFEEKVMQQKLKLNRDVILYNLKETPEFIIDVMGATEYGPAATFSCLVHAIAMNTNETIPVAFPLEIPEIGEKVWVSIPTKVGKIIKPLPIDTIPNAERIQVFNAARSIYKTYKEATEAINKN
jgi:malate dehydrogenase